VDYFGWMQILHTPQDLVQENLKHGPRLPVPVYGSDLKIVHYKTEKILKFCVTFILLVSNCGTGTGSVFTRSVGRKRRKFWRTVIKQENSISDPHRLYADPDPAF
jgi:hypothetical protein